PGMADMEREPGSGPQHDERQGRDRQFGNAARPAGGAVVDQDALPAPGVENVIARARRVNEAGALFLRVRPRPSCVLQRKTLLTVQREIAASVKSAPSSVDRFGEGSETCVPVSGQRKAAQPFGQV